MGSFSYEKQGASTYLVYTLADGEAVDSMSLGMITNNTIPGLAGTMFMQMNAVRYIKYNISSRIPVSQFFSGPVNRRRLLGVFDGIVSGLLAAEEYMIDTDTVLMDLNYIYADVSACDAVLICLPAAGFGREKTDLCLFFKEIMFRTQFDQTENCDHVTKIINYLNSAYIFSLTDFKELIRGLREGGTGVPSGYAGGGLNTNGASGPVKNSSGGSVSSEHRGGIPGGNPDGTGSIGAGPVSGYAGGVPGGGIPSGYPGAGPAASGPSGYPDPIPPIPGQGSGMGTGLETPPVPQPETKAETGGKEKGMSLFYLLRHYDKENAGIYKAQKEEKKQQKAAREPKKKEKPVKEKKGKAKKGTGFAIPGQMAPPVPPMPGGVLPGAGTVPPQGPGQNAVPPVMGRMPGAAPMQGPGQNAVPPVPGGVLPGAGAVPPQGPVPGMSTASAPPFPQPAGGMGTPGADFGNTVFMGGAEDDDGGATVIMGAGMGSAGPQIQPHLIRRRTNERIPISQNLFRLGRNQDFNDYVVLGNEFVGNTHCHILVRGEEYFVVDDNSKNHTFVNGVMVMPGTEVKLMHGQTVTLADEEFEFRLFG